MTVRLLGSVCLVVILVASRGFLLAWTIEGRYPLSALVLDSLALGLLLLALHVFDGALRWSLRKIAGTTRPLLVQTIRLVVLIVVLVPFLITTLSIHPQRVICTQTPARLGLSFEEVSLQSEGLLLDGWYIPGDNEAGPVVLVAHGLGANKQNFLLPVMELNSLGYPVLIFDFRGHGDSDGFLTTFGLREAEDVKAAHDWLANRHPGRPLCALAYSMGGAAVTRSVEKYGIFDRVVLDSSFSSARNVAHVHYLRYFGPLASWAWSQGRFWVWLWTGADLEENSPTSYADAFVHKPTLLIHGADDSMIPSSESVRLHEAFGDRSQLWLVSGANHIETILEPDYFRRIGAFFEDSDSMDQ